MNNNKFFNNTNPIRAAEQLSLTKFSNNQMLQNCDVWISLIFWGPLVWPPRSSDLTSVDLSWSHINCRQSQCCQHCACGFACVKTVDTHCASHSVYVWASDVLVSTPYPFLFSRDLFQSLLWTVPLRQRFPNFFVHDPEFQNSFALRSTVCQLGAHFICKYTSVIVFY